MQITLDLNPETEAELIAQAEAHGLDVATYVQSLIDQSARSKMRPRVSEREFQRMLDRLAQKVPNVPHLRNETFSRSMIYRDHD